MITMIVTYAGDDDRPFNRDHWINVHFPILRRCWGPYGLISVASYFPPADGAGIIATVAFRDEEAMHAALMSPEAERVIADGCLVTSVQPERRLARSL